MTELLCGESREVISGLPSNSFDAVVTDPPYEIGLLKREWDRSGIANNPFFWDEILRVAKPGAHLVAFASPRTYHRLATAIESAGWELRDQLMWIYASGFPKSLNLERATGDQALAGWGTALKPAHEPIVLARKPVEGSLTENVQKWGVGGLNLAACRVGNEPRKNNPAASTSESFELTRGSRDKSSSEVVGRWPANVMFDDRSKDFFTWSKFFFISKPSVAEREAGCSGLPPRAWTDGRKAHADTPRLRAATARRNWHESVKPIDLMRYLVRLVCPPGGRVLDPFVGSGTTAVSCLLEKMDCLGIEFRADVLEIAAARVEAARSGAFAVGPDDRVVVRKESEGQLDLF